MESLAGPRLVSVTARRHNISRSLLVTWRRALNIKQSASTSPPSFVPAVVAEPPRARLKASDGACGEGRIEIILPHDRRLIIDASIDPVVLARVLDVLERR